MFHSYLLITPFLSIFSNISVHIDYSEVRYIGQNRNEARAVVKQKEAIHGRFDFI